MLFIVTTSKLIKQSVFNTEPAFCGSEPENEVTWHLAEKQNPR
jgi:hypothetical protein